MENIVDFEKGLQRQVKRKMRGELHDALFLVVIMVMIVVALVLILNIEWIIKMDSKESVMLSSVILAAGFLLIPACFYVASRFWPLDKEKVKAEMDKMREDFLTEKIEELEGKEESGGLSPEEEDDLSFYQDCLGALKTGSPNKDNPLATIHKYSNHEK
ncbi:MAG: hypothetical protein ACM3PZ_03270 [Bacillota bacterium]